jgi:hypothetical protein
MVTGLVGGVNQLDYVTAGGDGAAPAGRTKQLRDE